MNIRDTQAFIRAQARANAATPKGDQIYWSRHAIEEAVKDGLTRAEIEHALLSALVIEAYPATHRPLPDCLVLGFLAADRPIHAVIAIDVANMRLFILTVYVPSEARWYDDWQTRK